MYDGNQSARINISIQHAGSFFNTEVHRPVLGGFLCVIFYFYFVWGFLIIFFFLNLVEFETMCYMHIYIYTPAHQVNPSGCTC